MLGGKRGFRPGTGARSWEPEVLSFRGSPLGAGTRESGSEDSCDAVRSVGAARQPGAVQAALTTRSRGSECE